MEDILEYSLNEDIGFEDITTKALINEEAISKARIVTREDCVLAGCEIATEVFTSHGLKLTFNKKDGDELKKGDIVLTVEGSTSKIITLERTVLNFIMRLSGIATLSSQLNKKVKEVNPNIIIAGTRKTTPGLQKYEKSAMKIAGIDTHRFKLDDAVLIKDNHIEAVGSIEEAIRRAKDYVSFTKKIEIEVENLQDALTAANEGVDIIMLDNMSIDEIELVLNTFESKNIRDNFLVEVSGGINPDNILDYARTDADIISLGMISHSAKSIDMSLEII